MAEDTGYSEVLRLLDGIIVKQSNDPHFQAVQAMCSFVQEILDGIALLTRVNNGISAEALYRTLFEASVNTIVLAKNRRKLGDFKEHARFTHQRILRVLRVTESTQHNLDKVLRQIAREYSYFESKFKSIQAWHGMKKSESFEAANLSRNLRSTYYVRGSAIAHGEPWVVFIHRNLSGRRYRIGARPDYWEKCSVTARDESLLMTLHLLVELNVCFKLKLDDELLCLNRTIMNSLAPAFKNVFSRTIKARN